MNHAIIGVLEQQRRDALVAWYLGQLVQQGAAPRRVLNEEDLYEYLLIDNQVGAQVDTSRVAQGIASVQQHIHAIYNGMEPGYESVVHDNRALWRDGMSQYSLWSGYQMLEDYPENYLQPALRLDKTSLFETFEAELSQARLSRDTAQQALGNYLQTFETLANLSIISGYVDGVDFREAEYYFVGRQNIEPFGFYWRKTRAYPQPASEVTLMAGWTQWKPVESVTGVHIKHCRPVVMDGRLYVIWVESGKAVLDKEGQKTGRFEYAIKLAYRRLDDSWSAPIVLHNGEAPDELLPNVFDDKWAITKGYRLMACTDHRNGGRSRLLVGFISKGFTNQDINQYLVFDEFLVSRPIDPAVATILLFMAGTDSRRLQYCADELDADTDLQWKVTSVAWDKTAPPTTMGATGFAMNEHLELKAQWQNGQLALRGVCNTVLNVWKNTEFESSGAVGPGITHGYTVKVTGAEGVTRFTVMFYRVHSADLLPQNVELTYEERTLGILRTEDFKLESSFFWDFYSASMVIDEDPDAFNASLPSGFQVSVRNGPPIRLNDEYYRYSYEPAVMSSGLAHYKVGWLQEGENLTLNGAAQSAIVYDPWPADGGTVRTYQWGGDATSGDREKFGMNGFTVTREPVSDAAPNIVTAGTGVQYLGTLAGGKRIRLNTLCAKVLTRKASLSLEGALSWETQHTEEPALQDETAPVYLDFSGAYGLYFWELFVHIPHLVASRLQQEFDYAGAQSWLEHLFNPQMRVAPLFPPPAQTDWLPYWTCRPLGLADNPLPELGSQTNPDAIARSAPSHYRKAIFMQYLNNLIAWGDMLYRQVTRDTLNEAKLLYVRALSLLGPLSKGRSISHWEPVTLGEASNEGDSSFTELESSLAATLSTLLPLSATQAPWLRLLDQDIFRLPVNTQLLDVWDRLDLRLYNLRHNLTLDGKPMHLALYEAPANPLDLLRAQLNGSSVSQRRLGSLAIIPPYRLRAMMPRAQNAVDTLIRFAQQVLNHMEARYRAEQEELQQGHVLDDLAAFAEQLQQSAIDESVKGLEVLKANRQSVVARKRYYDDQLRVDVSALEKTAHTERQVAMGTTVAARALGAAGHIASLAPNLFGGATGGMHWGGPAFAEAEVMEGAATVLSELAQQQLTSDLQSRRRDEWQHQVQQAELETEMVDRQIEAQEAAVNASRASLAQAAKTREQAQAFYAFIKGRATNAGLYQWLLSQMSTLYFQAYDAVLSMCLSTEACWQYEVGDRETRFISASAWVDNRFGLTAGDTLRLGLMQMESAFLTRHERRLEITKTLSLKALLKDYDPGAGRQPDAVTGWDAVLDTLRTTGEIEFQLNSSTFDRDYPGHYLRQLVRLSVSLPVVLKPYQDIHATLSQQTSTYLLKPQIGNVKSLYQQVGELPEGDDDDLRQDQLVTNPRANQQVGLSTGVDDHGMFQLDFGDERYFPFEGTGAISRWTLSFPNHDSEDQQAMLDTLTDVILHIRYLAVDGGKAFAADVEKLVSAVEEVELKRQPISLA